MLSAYRGRHPSRLLQVAIAAALLALIGHFAVKQFCVQLDSRHLNDSAKSPVVGPQTESPELERLVRRHAQLVDSLHDPAIPDKDAPTKPAAVPEFQSLPSKTPYDFDLAVYFLKSLGSLEAARVGWHTDLNPGGISLTGERLESLRRILATANARTAQLHASWKEVRRQEMISQIDAGHVAPAPEPPPREGTVRFLAETLLASSDLSSKGYTIDSLSEEIRKNPGIGFGAGVDIFVHKGKTYCMSDFKHLPVADSLMDTNRYFAWEALALCFAWSLEHGCSPSEARVAFALDRILSVSAAELRGAK